jgi:hypothetical protein
MNEFFVRQSNIIASLTNADSFQHTRVSQLPLNSFLVEQIRYLQGHDKRTFQTGYKSSERKKKKILTFSKYQELGVRSFSIVPNPLSAWFSLFLHPARPTTQILRSVFYHPKKQSFRNMEKFLRFKNML